MNKNRPSANLQNKPNSNPIKPNLKNAKMNLNSVKTKDYVNESRLRPPAKQTQSNPISPPFLSIKLASPGANKLTISALRLNLSHP